MLLDMNRCGHPRRLHRRRFEPTRMRADILIWRSWGGRSAKNWRPIINMSLTV